MPESRQFSAAATRQITQVAKLMSLRLDPSIPEEAALLESLERALLRLRKESNGTQPGRDVGLQNNHRTPAPVLRGGYLGLDIDKEEHF